MKIIVGFSKPKKSTIIAWLISKVCKTEYDHTYFQYTENLTGDDMIIEASHGEVHEELKSSWLEKNIVIREYSNELSPIKYIEFQKFINKSLNKPYNKLLLVGIMLEKVFKIKNDIGMNGEGFICHCFTYI